MDNERMKIFFKKLKQEKLVANYFYNMRIYLTSSSYLAFSPNFTDTCLQNSFCWSKTKESNKIWAKIWLYFFEYEIMKGQENM